jgi:hypothetical protein
MMSFFVTAKSLLDPDLLCVNTSNMDPRSECYCILPCLSHLPVFSLDALPFTDEELAEAGLLGEGKSLSHFLRLSIFTISLVGVSPVVAQVFETMDKHPDLLSKSLSFFPHTYHFAFRAKPVHAPVH